MIFSLLYLIILFPRNIINLLFVAIIQLSLHCSCILLEVIQFIDMPSYLLIFLIYKGLDSTRGLQELFIVFPDFLLQLLLFKSPIE